MVQVRMPKYNLGAFQIRYKLIYSGLIKGRPVC